MKKKKKKQRQQKSNQETSKHYNKHRYKREKFIEKYLHGDGAVIDSFIVDKGHANGREIHKLTDNGVVLIYNMESGLLVTKLIIREGQLKRYYANTGREPPEYLVRLAKWHEDLNYNR